MERRELCSFYVCIVYMWYMYSICSGCVMWCICLCSVKYVICVWCDTGKLCMYVVLVMYVIFGMCACVFVR